jgi:ATP-binding cassette subfamily B protein
MSTAPGEGPELPVRAIFAWFWPLTEGHRRWIIAAAALLAFAAACDAAGVLFFASVVDDALVSGGLARFWTPALAWTALAVTAAAASFAGSTLNAWVGERFLLALRGRLYDHVRRLPPDFFEGRQLGDLVVRLSEDIMQVEELLITGVVGAVSSGVAIVCFLAALIYLQAQLAVAAILVVPVTWLLGSRFTRRVRAVAQDERAGTSAIVAALEETLGNATLVQTYGQGDRESRRLHAIGVRFMTVNMRQARLAGAYSAAIGLLETLALIAVLALGAWEISRGRFTVGGLLGFAAFLAYLYPPLQSLGHLRLTAGAAGAGAERLIDLLEVPVTVDDTDASVGRLAGPGSLVFSGVGFTYPGRKRPSVLGLDLRVEPGDLLIITGGSGAGKSTIAKLAMRFYDPTEGRILLDGVDLRNYTLEALRESLCVLTQETLLFDASITDNISYSRPGASRDDIERAARAAGLDQFLSTLPAGYEFLVGQRGRRLSGGQRQRIAIARAFLRDAAVLILDEPTTGLDTTAAAALTEPLRRLAADRSTIMITHDLRMAPEATCIVVLEDGRIVEQGSHEYLLSLGGAYQKLWLPHSGPGIRRVSPY